MPTSIKEPPPPSQAAPRRVVGKRFLIVLSGFIGFFLLFQYVFLPLFLKHDKVQERILSVISAETKGAVEFQKLSLSVFPSLSFQIQDLVYTSQNEKEPLSFRADVLKGRLELLPLLIGDIKLKRLAIDNASIKGRIHALSNKTFPFELNGFHIRAKGIRKKSLGEFSAHGKLFSDVQNFQIAGSLQLGNLAQFKLEDLKCDLTVTLTDVPLEPLLVHRLKFLPLRIIGGNVSGEIQMSKAGGERKGRWNSSLNLNDILYADPQNPDLSFPKASTQLTFKGSWDADESLLSVLGSQLQAKGVQGELVGDFAITDQGLQDFDFHVGFPEYHFKNVILNFPFVRYWFQTGVDLDGQGEIRFQAKGNFNDFNLQGELSLKDADIDYAYFKKSKGEPLSLKTNIRLEQGTQWSGDFDFRYKELKVKGTVVELEPKTEKLHLTVLTNKFHLATFLDATASTSDKLIWDGDVKVLINYKGLLGDPENAKIKGVINLDEVAYGLKGLSLKTPPLTSVLKIDDTEIIAEKSYFQFGTEQVPFNLHWKGWDSPRIYWSMKGGTVDLKTLFQTEGPAVSRIEQELNFDFEFNASTEDEKVEGTVKAKGAEVELPEWLERAKAVGEISLEAARWNEAIFQGVTGSFVLENGSWKIPSLSGKGAGGVLWLEAEQDLKYQDTPSVRLFGKRLLLSQIYPEGSLSGSASFKLYNVRDPNPSNIVRGNLLVQKGSLQDMDFLKEITGSSSFSAQTDFNQMGTWIRIGETQTDLSDIVLSSKDLWLKSKGQIMGESQAAFTGQALLSRKQSKLLDSSLLRNQQFVIPFEVRGILGDLEPSFNSKEMRSIEDTGLQKDIAGKVDYLRFLDRLSPKGISLPDKSRFLQESKRRTRKPRKQGGFFEIFFGRRR